MNVKDTVTLAVAVQIAKNGIPGDPTMPVDVRLRLQAQKACSEAERLEERADPNAAYYRVLALALEEAADRGAAGGR